MTQSNRDRIQEIFLDALELPDSERSAFVEKNCAGDPDCIRDVNSIIEAAARFGILDVPVLPLGLNDNLVGTVYPIMYLDAIQLKVRDGGHVRNKAIYLAIAITVTGMKEVLGLWIAQTEGAKFWLQVVTEPKNRGVKDIFIACVDGLKDFPEVIESIFPQTEVQLCIVHWCGTR